MTKFIERVVNSAGSPLRNDIWLRWIDGSPHLFTYDGTEWKEIVCGGSGPTSGSGSSGGQSSPSSDTVKVLLTYDGSTENASLPDNITFEDIAEALKAGKEVMIQMFQAYNTEGYEEYGLSTFSYVSYIKANGIECIAIGDAYESQGFIMSDGTFTFEDPFSEDNGGGSGELT